MELDPGRGHEIAMKVAADVTPEGMSVTVFPLEPAEGEGLGSRVRVNLGSSTASDLDVVIAKLEALRRLIESEKLAVESVQSSVVLKASTG